MRERADIIRNSVHKTGDHLKEQTVHTDKLVEQALSLVAAVSVLTLKEEEQEKESTVPELVKEDGKTEREIKTEAIEAKIETEAETGAKVRTKTADIDIDLNFSE